MTDFPFADVSRKASILSSQGHAVHQKYTCSGCGRRNIVKTPGLFLDSVKCDRCGKVTDLRKSGCNYEFR
jgi:uncharacterized protein CbrC (UPF0167 family)